MKTTQTLHRRLQYIVTDIITAGGKAKVTLNAEQETTATTLVF